MTPTHGQQASLQPPRTEPGPPPAPANPITYEAVQVSLHLGRGIVIDTAPEHSKITVNLLADPIFGVRATTPGRVRFAEQVEYEITGYDPGDCTLTLRLVKDYRPGQKDAPEGPTP
jgi:hypothetical protein